MIIHVMGPQRRHVDNQALAVSVEVMDSHVLQRCTMRMCIGAAGWLLLKLSCWGEGQLQPLLQLQRPHASRQKQQQSAQ